MSDHSDVVITGLGVVSPLGVGLDEFWDNLIAGKSGVKVRPGFEHTSFPQRIYAPIDDFEGKKYIKPRKALKVMCRPIQFGCAAAAMAATDAGLDDFEANPDRIGTVFGTETFFADPLEVADVFRKCIVDQNYQHERWGEFAMREIQPLWMLKYLPNMVASHISIAMDARGPSNSICQGEASSILAIIEAVDLIKRGAADIVVAGGTGSRLALTSMLYRGTQSLSKRVMVPTEASRPFDQSRDGMVAGEGAGAIILESRAHAEQRGAKPYGQIVGAARTHCDRDDERFVPAVEELLSSTVADNHLNVDQLNAHADSTIMNDLLEARAIHAAMGDVPVASTKGHMGNLGPGGSAAELAALVLGLKHCLVPMTMNLENLDHDCPVNASGENRRKEGTTGLKLSISSTGQIACLGVQVDR